MGQEAVCTVRYTGQVSTGKALLESQELIFRGEFRLKIPLTGIHSLGVHDGVLIVAWPEGLAEFDLGPLAIKWESKIKNPKSLVEKLGVKQGFRVGVLGMSDPGFLADLRKKTPDVLSGQTPENADLVFIRCDNLTELRKVASLKKRIKSNGAIWVVYPKGHKTVTQTAVFAAGKKAGLVDVKVAAFSDTHTALKFVIPRQKR